MIYSGEIASARTELDCGLYTYRVNPIYLTDYDADKIFQRMQEKLDNGEVLNEEDYAGLALAPLMSGKLSRKEKIKRQSFLQNRERLLLQRKPLPFCIH